MEIELDEQLYARVEKIAMVTATSVERVITTFIHSQITLEEWENELENFKFLNNNYEQ